LYLELGLGARSIDFEAADSNETQLLGLARFGYDRTLADVFKIDLNIQASRSDDDVIESNAEVGLAFRLPTGSVRIAYRSQLLKVGDNDAITDEDMFVSYGYGF